MSEAFYLVRTAFNVIRAQIKKFIHNPDLALDTQSQQYLSAIEFLRDFSPTLLPNMKCFSSADYENLFSILNRPISIFGVVKREPGDQGGGPVFASMPNGNKIKICLEMSHANESDRNEYFGPNGKLNYFNPVLVFFETRTGAGDKTDFQDLFNENFWLLSKRYYQNSTVYYHETALYELIGNSEKTNLVFVEVPRTLFNPHKNFLDSAGKSRKSYGLYLPSL